MPDDDEAQIDRSATIAGRIERSRRKRRCNDEVSMDCYFIVVSVAIVERLWTTAKSFLPDNRKKTTPAISESLLFLCVNHKCWNEMTAKKLFGCP